MNNRPAVSQCTPTVAAHICAGPQTAVQAPPVFSIRIAAHGRDITLPAHPVDPGEEADV